ncbi:tetratricopeptide repeat protein [Candidatus Micrarchaeota archaeon]|nr:tetratricopeptide repeat protein [Candidatus Micrarchaeota archaeon]
MFVFQLAQKDEQKTEQTGLPSVLLTVKKVTADLGPSCPLILARTIVKSSNPNETLIKVKKAFEDLSYLGSSPKTPSRIFENEFFVSFFLKNPEKFVDTIQSIPNPTFLFYTLEKLLGGSSQIGKLLFDNDLFSDFVDAAMDYTGVMLYQLLDRVKLSAFIKNPPKFLGELKAKREELDLLQSEKVAALKTLSTPILEGTVQWYRSNVPWSVVGIGVGPLFNVHTFAKFPYTEMSAYLDLAKKSSLRILYPAGGAHLAPLEMAVRFQQINPDLKVTFTYTEIDPSTPNLFLATAKQAKGAITVLGKSEQDFGTEGKEITIKLLVFGKPVDVVYALNRSSNFDPYFRKEDVFDSDIFLSHDSFDSYKDDYHAGQFGGWGLTTALSKVISLSAIRKTPKIFVFEDYGWASTGVYPPTIYTDILPGKVNLVNGRFGCLSNGNHSAGAVIYYPNFNTQTVDSRDYSAFKIGALLTSVMLNSKRTTGQFPFDVQEKIYLQAIANTPPSADLFTNLGLFYLEYGSDLSLLIPEPVFTATVDKLLKADPKNASLYLLRATFYDQQEKYQKALPAYTKAIALDPENLSIYVSRERVYEKLGHYQAALSDYIKILKSGYLESHHGIWFRPSYHEIASKTIIDAITKRPSDPILHYILAISYAQAGKPKDALREYEKALRLDPYNLELTYDLTAHLPY